VGFLKVSYVDWGAALCSGLLLGVLVEVLHLLLEGLHTLVLIVAKLLLCECS